MSATTFKMRKGIVYQAIIIIFIVLFSLMYVLPYIEMLWDMAFPHYDHEIVVLPFDIDCTIGNNANNAVRLPKGTMLYSPCRHDFSRMSLDEECTYKIYVKLKPVTIKKLIKDTDNSRHEEFLLMKNGNKIEELTNEEASEKVDRVKQQSEYSPR